MHIRGKKRVTCTQGVRRGSHTHKGGQKGVTHTHKGVRRGSHTQGVRMGVTHTQGESEGGHAHTSGVRRGSHARGKKGVTYTHGVRRGNMHAKGSEVRGSDGREVTCKGGQKWGGLTTGRGSVKELGMTDVDRVSWPHTNVAGCWLRHDWCWQGFVTTH